MRAYLLLENKKKSNNLGPELRCAAAFQISTVIAVGFSKCSVEGSHGASKHVEILAFPTVDQARQSMGSAVCLVGILGGAPIEKGYDINSIFPVHEEPESGLVQIRESTSINEAKAAATGKNSYPVASWPFDETKIHCFVICKSRRGLTLDLARQCDKFIHIPHRSMGHGFADGPLLDVPSCLSIVLHHFSEWAGQRERNFEGHKFELQRSNQPTTEQSEARRKERQEKMQRRVEEMVSEESVGNVATFFDDEGGDY